MNSPTHPSRTALQAVVAGALPDSTHFAHLRHASECPRCEEILAEELEAAEAGASAAAGVPPSRAARWSARRSAWLAAASVALVALGTVVLPSHDLTARDMAGDLRLAPALPAPGDSIHVEYRGERFEGEERLRLRGTFRAAGDEEPEWAGTHVVVTELVKARDGVFRGSFVLPSSAVYGAFVVEDRDGSHVDSHGGKLWDVMVRDTLGRASFAAMRQRMRYLGERDRELPLAMARELVSVHPEQVESWQVRQFYDLQYAGRAGGDSLRAAYAAHFASSHARLAAGERVAPAVMETMWLYASQVGDTAASRYWTRRLAREHPRSPEGARQLVFAARAAHAGDDAFDAEAERLWETTADDSRQPIAFAAFMSARTSGNAPALQRWGARLERMGSPWYNRSFVGYTLAGTRGAEGEGAKRLRLHLAELGRTTDAHRLLGRTVAQQDVHTAELRAGTLAALGKALVATGQLDAALDTLELAASTWWSSSVYAAIASVKLARGDSLGAAHAAAFAAVDAQTAEAAAAIRRRYRAPASDSAWNAWVAEGRRVLKRQLLASSVVRPVRAEVRVSDSNGREHTLRDLTRGHLSAVAFFSRQCLGSLEQMADLQRAAVQLARGGVKVIAITREAPSPLLTDWLKAHGSALEVYHDTRGEAATVLEPYGTPDHLVLDAQGRVRFDRLTAAELPSYVAALQ